jgi:hypothetical protein
MKWVEFAKGHKETWMKVCEKGDMPPFVIAERDGEPEIVVMAPQVDKHLALNAAQLCHVGLGCDALVIITDGFHLIVDRPEDMEPEEYNEYHEAKYKEIQDKYGNFQEAFEAGEDCIGEVITCIRCTKEGDIQAANCQYKREGEKVTWEEDQILSSTQEGAEISGNIPDALRHIVGIPPMFGGEEMNAAAEACGLDDDPEKQLYHCRRVIRRLLHEKDYLIVECIKWKESDGYGVLLNGIMDKFKEAEELYDFDNMKTNPEYLNKYSDN